MSHPIKIVEDSEHSPTKNINVFKSNLTIQNQSFENSSIYQLNQVNSLYSSSTFNKYTELSNLSNKILFNDVKFLETKEKNPTEFEQATKSDGPTFKNNFKNSFIQMKTEEKIGREPELSSNGISYNYETKQISFEKYKDYLNKENSSKNINEKISYNNYLNNNIKNSKIKEYFQKLKELTNNIMCKLESMQSKYSFLLDNNDGTNINTSEKMNIEENCSTYINQEEKHNIKLVKDTSIINQKNKIQKENIVSSLRFSKNLKNKEKNKEPFLNVNKTKSIIKQRNQDLKDEFNNNNNSSAAPHAKIKTFKRINNRKFNIKKRGLRYNILTEEMKKQLLLDAMNMRTVEVAKKYGISTRNVNRWKKKGIQRKKGSGRKFKDPRLERKILEWYRMHDKETLTSKQFKEKAIELSDNKTFRASSGWLTNMKRKYNINFKKY